MTFVQGHKMAFNNIRKKTSYNVEGSENDLKRCKYVQVYKTTSSLGQDITSVNSGSDKYLCTGSKNYLK